MRVSWPLELVESHTELASTQNRAMELARSGASEGSTVIAQTQSAGRGRFARVWFSKPGGLWMSVLLRPALPMERPGLLSLLAGLAIHDVLRNISSIEAGLKWPNDVYVEGKKICGILMEQEARSGAIILGIGVNVNFLQADFPDEIRARAVSLRMCTGQKHDLPAVAEAVRLALWQRYQQFQNKAHALTLSEWKKHNITLGTWVNVQYGPGHVISGQAIDLSPEGFLLVQDRQGLTQTITAGELLAEQP